MWWGRRGRQTRTNDELDEEEEDVDYEQEYDACFARHRGCMQALGRRRQDELWWENPERARCPKLCPRSRHVRLIIVSSATAGVVRSLRAQYLI